MIELLGDPSRKPRDDAVRTAIVKFFQMSEPSGREACVQKIEDMLVDKSAVQRITAADLLTVLSAAERARYLDRVVELVLRQESEGLYQLVRLALLCCTVD